MSVRRVSLATATGADLDAVGRLLREYNLQFEAETPSAQVLATRVAELLGDGDTEVVLAGEPAAGVAVVRLRKAIWTAHREASLVEIYLEAGSFEPDRLRELVEGAIAAARERGADFIELSAGASEVQARQVYEQLDFDAHELGSDESLALHYTRAL